MSDERLVVHLDVNETLILGDEAGGDTWEESLNKVIAKQAIVRDCVEGSDEDLETLLSKVTWSDGTALFAGEGTLCNDFRIPEETARLYRVPALKTYAKSFTADGSPGRVFRPIFEQAQEKLRGHVIFPAALRLLESLNGKTIVLRTFGSDIGVVQAALDGRLPDANIFKVHRDDNDKITFRQQQQRTLSEDEMIQILEEKPGCYAIQDDYPTWRGNGYDPRFGKPVWIGAGITARHIFFDDNIHNDPTDSIVNVRRRHNDGSFLSIDGEAILNLEHTTIVRVPTIAAILDDNWFVDHLALCCAQPRPL